METLHRQIGRARRRLTFQRFLDLLALSLTALLSLALAVVVADRFWPLGLIAWAWPAGAAVIGLAAAAILASCRSASRMETAIEIDRRFGLKERVSSAMALATDECRTEAGEAVVADAVRQIDRIDVPSQFKIKPPRRLLLPLVPAAISALVILLIAQTVAQTPPAAAAAVDPAAAKQVHKTSETVRRQLADRRKKAETQGLQDATDLFTKLEAGIKECSNEPSKEKAMAKLNDLSRILADRQKQIGGAAKIKEQLDTLKNVDRGPADQFAQAAAQGDFQKAAEELDKLKKQLDKGELGEQEKKQMAQQFEQMKQKLEQQVKAHQAAENDLKRQLDQARKAGQAEQANRLEEQLAKLQDKLPQMQAMQDMAKKLGNCSKCVREGKQGNAAQALGEMQGAMAQMQKQVGEMEMMDEAQMDLADAKKSLSDAECDGDNSGNGAKAAQNAQECPNGGPGNGIGTAFVKGSKPGEKINTSFYDSQVKQNVSPGAGMVVDMVKGPNVRGAVEQQVQEQFEAVKQGTTDPLANRRLPKKHGQHAKDYYDSLREGK